MSEKVTLAVKNLLEPHINDLGYEIESIEFRTEEAYEGAKALDIRINKPGGVNLDDCIRVTRTINPILDEADPIPFSYVLEVSSPGIEPTTH